MVDHFDDWDQKEIKSDKQKVDEKRGERKEFQASLKEMRKTFREKVKREKCATKKQIENLIPSRDRAMFKDPLQGNRKRYPTQVLPGDLATATVENMAPPGCRVYHDTWNGRWLMSQANMVKSRSWLKYGHSESAIVLLSKMWKRFQEIYGLDECPVSGLHDQAALFEANVGCEIKSAAELRAEEAEEAGVDAD